ncbi:MAG: ABC transporter ATP-binding protein [Acidobacteria bacterium]|nr:ABC transporter ATP-binding protein [Acidobacteriota bacterium]
MSDPQDDVVGKAYDARLMRRLLVYLRPHVPAASLALVAIIGGSVVELAQPWLTQLAIDTYIANRDLPGLRWVAIAFFGLLIANFVFEFLQTVVMQTIGQKIMRTIRLQVFGHLQKLDLAFYDRNPVGRLMTRVTTDVDALNDLFASGVITVFGDILALTGIITAMLWMNWRLALVAFIVLPGILWATHWFRRNVRESYRQVRGLVARVNAFLQEHLTGMSTVQLFGQERRTFERFDAINAEHRDVNIRSIFYYAVFYPMIETMAALSGALIIWIGGGWQQEGLVSLGVLVAFLQYSRRFFQPISDLSEKFNILQAAMAASERIFTVLDTPPTITKPTAIRADAVLPRSVDPRVPRMPLVEFEHVWFAYVDGPDGQPQWVLKDVSFVVDAGQRIGIVGATGSGKTTIISLLLRFYDVQRGHIRVDGVDITEMDPAELRGIFGLVLQDVHLFAGTVAGNIRLGRADIDDAAVHAAARSVHADDFIRAMPQGYQTEVAERGATLSVGQKQLLSFARALAFEPRVLVLDEATSSVDTATETLIEDALKVMMAGRTVVAIAHRLSTIQDMDRILVLHKGELRESGSHQELLALRGLYFRLYELSRVSAANR